jgi:hypothetical protein
MVSKKTQNSSKIASSTEGKYKVECGAAFEVIFCCCLVVGPITQD